MAFCSKCGTELTVEAAFCSACGASTVAPARSASAQFSAASADMSDALEIFVGKNYDYYTRKWQIAGLNKGKNSWNWAAFLVGFIWMSYRKMYLYSFLYIGAVLVETLLEYAVRMSDRVSIGISFVIAIYLGLQGNHLYRNHAEKRVGEIISANTPERAKIELARQGGTSSGAAIGFAVLLLAALFLAIVVG